MKNLNNYGILLAATILWSVAPSLIKYVLGNLDPFPFLFIRFLIIAIVCLPLLLKILKKNKYSSYDKMNLLIFGLTGQTSLILFFVGMNYTSAVDSIIISLSAPLISIAAGHYFYKEKLNIYKEIGIAIASFGTLLVIVEPAFSNHSTISANDRIFGNLCILLYQVIFTFWGVYTKFLFGKNSVFLIKVFKYFKVNLHKKSYNIFDFSLISFYIGFLTFIPLAFFDLSKYFNQVASLDVYNWGAIGYMAIFSSIVAYYLFVKAQSKLQITEVSIFSYISPLFALPAAFFILGEMPSYYSFAGIAVILVGLFIAEKLEIRQK
jgi:drug/metabolite transporter (DMT)-like permease